MYIKTNKPLGTISSRQQVDKSNTPPRDLLERIIREEGIKGLYSGVSSAIFGIAVTQSVYYYWYETVKNWFPKKDQVTAMQSIIAGFIAGAATTVSTNPIWVINVHYF